jgi:N6-adenosine-specific RNA methylase IME4
MPTCASLVALVIERSRKPAEIHDRSERLVAEPYLELYAPRKRQGCLTWGDELPFKVPSNSGDVPVSRRGAGAARGATALSARGGVR